MLLVSVSVQYLVIFGRAALPANPVRFTVAQGDRLPSSLAALGLVSCSPCPSQPSLSKQGEQRAMRTCLEVVGPVFGRAVQRVAVRGQRALVVLLGVRPIDLGVQLRQADGVVVAVQVPGKPSQPVSVACRCNCMWIAQGTHGNRTLA